jgi:tRNA pseudouridine55 synthase
MDTSIYAFLNVHKPSGMTSHDVVAFMRKCLQLKQVGHGGTLDPMASGVLPIALNRACRLLRFLSDKKTYLAEILLGTTTDTDDITGSVTATSKDIPNAEEVIAALTSFVGTIEQKPPNYSAIHIGGKRLYEMARSGSVPEEIPVRKVTVFKLEPIQIELPVLKVRIVSSGGFYVRSLARDLGQKLGCGGCLKSLIREQAGDLRIENAIPLDKFTNAAQSNSLSELLISPSTVLPLKQLDLNEEEAKALIKGQKVKKSSIANNDKTEELPLLLTKHDEKLIAVCRQTIDNYLLPEVVLADAI